MTQGPRQPVSWDEFFMSIANFSMWRSKDPGTQVGSCFENSNRTLGIGYNSFPYGIPDSALPWTRGNPGDPIDETKYAFSHHSEPNGATNRIMSILGSKLYVSLLPCMKCTPILGAFQIDEVIFNSDKYKGEDNYQTSMRWLEECGILVRQFKSPLQIELNFQFGSKKPIIPYDRTVGRDFNPDENPSHISKKTYFMGLALLAALKSKDPLLQQGATLVSPDDRISSVGYNGLPPRMNDDAFDWSIPLDDEYRSIVVSAIINAIVNAPPRVPNSTLYTTHFPNHVDARFIIPEGVKKIYYGHNKNGASYRAAKKMFDLAGVTHERFTPDLESLVIDLSGNPQGSIGTRCQY